MAELTSRSSPRSSYQTTAWSGEPSGCRVDNVPKTVRALQDLACPPLDADGHAIPLVVLRLDAGDDTSRPHDIRVGSARAAR